MKDKFEIHIGASWWQILGIVLVVLILYHLYGCTHVDPYVRKANLHPLDESVRFRSAAKTVITTWQSHPKSVKLLGGCKNIMERVVVYPVEDEKKLLDWYEYYNGVRLGKLGGFVKTFNSYHYIYIRRDVPDERAMFVHELLRALTICMRLVNLKYTVGEESYKRTPPWVFLDDDSVKKQVLKQLSEEL